MPLDLPVKVEPWKLTVLFSLSSLAFQASGSSGRVRGKEVTMQVALSPDAVAGLRFEIKGYRSKVSQLTYWGYERRFELAGIACVKNDA